jgi:hypothetical protein
MRVLYEVYRRTPRGRLVEPKRQYPWDVGHPNYPFASGYASLHEAVAAIEKALTQEEQDNYGENQFRLDELVIVQGLRP